MELGDDLEPPVPARLWRGRLHWYRAPGFKVRVLLRTLDSGKLSSLALPHPVRLESPPQPRDGFLSSADIQHVRAWNSSVFLSLAQLSHLPSVPSTVSESGNKCSSSNSSWCFLKASLSFCLRWPKLFRCTIAFLTPTMTLWGSSVNPPILKLRKLREVKPLVKGMAGFQPRRAASTARAHNRIRYPHPGPLAQTGKRSITPEGGESWRRARGRLVAWNGSVSWSRCWICRAEYLHTFMYVYHTSLILQ